MSVDLLRCPHCGEPCELTDADDLPPGRHELVQDCDVCCQPIAVQLLVSPNGRVHVEASR